MSDPNGSDTSTDSDVLTRETTADSRESSRSLTERVTDWAHHWQALGVAAFSLLVTGWAVFVAPQTSPKGYIPIFVGFALLAVGYVYLNEETQLHLTSG